nr:hypothetical protein [Tanacetum cinerariifolium]
EGSGTPTESHKTPNSKASQSSQHELPSPSLLPVSTESLPTVIPSINPPLKQYTRRTRIAQSLVIPPVPDEPASPLRDDSEGEACPTDSGFKADQDRANIVKTSTLPSDSTPRVTSFAADEGTQELEINSLKARIKLLEDNDRGVADQSKVDAPIKGRRLDKWKDAAERVNDDTKEMATILTSMDAASILTIGGVQVVPTAAEVATATVSIHTGSGMVSTASPTIPTVALLFTRRCLRWGMCSSFPFLCYQLRLCGFFFFPQEQIDVQLARELEEEMAKDAQKMNEQIARDA